MNGTIIFCTYSEGSQMSKYNISKILNMGKINGNIVINFSIIIIQMNSCTKYEQKVTWQHMSHIWDYQSLMKYKVFHLFNEVLFTAPN